MRLTFLGGADEIGASCILVETAGRRVLVDCGVRMSAAAKDPLPDLRSIQEAGGLDAIVVTHAHLDHTGALPVVHAAYPQAPVLATEPTWTLLKVLLLDAVKIMGERLDREGELPLYSREAVEALLARGMKTRFLEPVELAGDAVTVTPYPAGHILGASSVAISSSDGVVLISGDYSVTDQLTVPGMLPPRLRADVVVTESTYGDRLHASRPAEEQRLVETVAAIIEAGGKVLIPAFALGRAQEVILILKRAFERKRVAPFPVWVDGMVRSVCDAYTMHPQWLAPWLRRRIEKRGDPFFDPDGPVRRVEQPKQRAEIVAGPPCCIVASSGMLSGGPSQAFAAMLAPDPKNLIAITGYQDEEAPGRVLLDLAEGKTRELRIGGEIVPVACRVGRYSLSAHADGSEVAQLLEALRPKDAVLVHGEAGARPALSRSAGPRVRHGIFLPALGDTLAFSYRQPRERPVVQPLPGFGPARPPDSTSVTELATLLAERHPLGRPYDLPELAAYWGLGGSDSESKEALRAILTAGGSPFEPDAKRPFLYRLRKLEAPAPEPSWPLDQIAALGRVDALLAAASDLYRKSVHAEEKRIELCFAFPAVAVAEQAGVLEQLTRETGWSFSIYPEVRIERLTDLAVSLVPEDWGLPRRPAFHREEGVLVVYVSAVPPEWAETAAEIAAELQRRTGIVTQFERMEDAGATREIRDADGRLEINQAMAAIDRFFGDAPHKPGKKSRRADAGGPYIEVGFISPAIASLYADRLEEAASFTGWRVVAGDRTDQEAILRCFRELWPASHPIRKGPSLHVAQGLLRVVAAAKPPAEELAALAVALKERTGFALDVGV